MEKKLKNYYIKNLFFIILPLVGFISCTKTNVSDKVDEIATIQFHNPDGLNASRNPCGDCPGHIELGYPIIQEGVPYNCLHSTSSLCGINGPTYRSSGNDSGDGFEGSFQNVNGRLQLTVEKDGLSAEKRLLYFNKNQFTFDKPEYMSEELLTKLSIQAPYLIRAGEYKITSENDSQFTILL